MLTKLEALNIILGSAQLSPVESLDSGDIDAETAESILKETLEEVQTRGWSWNKEVIKLSPTSEGFLILPHNVLDVDPKNRNLSYIQRGLKLYNKEENTFIFNKTVEVQIVLGLDFEDLPQSVRRYVSLKASRVFQQRTLGDPNINQYIMMEEAAAYSQLVMADVRSKDANMITGGPVSSRMKRRVTSWRR